MKSIQCIENGKVYKSAKEAGQDLHIDVSSIGKVCKGKLKQAGGYHFQFVENGKVENIENGKVENGKVEKMENGNIENGKVELTPDHLKKFRNVLTQPTLDLLAFTNTELINALANDILAYRNRVKDEMRKLAGKTNNNNDNVVNPPKPQQENDGWDEYERELETKEKENNPVMVEKPQPKNPYLQDEDDDDWSTSFDDVSEEEVIKWQNEHQDQFTPEELKAIEQEREQKKEEEEEKRRKQEEWDALTDEEKARRKEEEKQFFMEWFNNSLSRTKEQEKKRNEEFRQEMAKNKPAFIEEEHKNEPAENPVIEEQEPSTQEKDTEDEDMAWEEDFKNHPQWECDI